MSIKKGMQVKILVGKDKGKTGEILEILRKKKKTMFIQLREKFYIKMLFTVPGHFYMGLLSIELFG